MIVSINAEESFDKNQHPVIVNILNNMGIKGTFLNISKTFIINPHKTLHSIFGDSKSIFL